MPIQPSHLIQVKVQETQARNNEAQGGLHAGNKAKAVKANTHPEQHIQGRLAKSQHGAKQVPVLVEL